jgi:putative transposase
LAVSAANPNIRVRREFSDTDTGIFLIRESTIRRKLPPSLRQAAMHYRRDRTPGGTYFFTLTLRDRGSQLLIDRIHPLREAVAYVRRRHAFAIDAWVVLPEHLHAIWTLPQHDSDFATRWALIKARFSRGIAKEELITVSRRRQEERGIWQRRYWEHRIRNELDFARHVDYVHFNPVKHCHVRAASEWPYSTIHRHIEKGLLPADWGGSTGRSQDFLAGERR